MKPNEPRLDKIRRDLLASAGGGLDYVDSMYLLERLDNAEWYISELGDSTDCLTRGQRKAHEAWERAKAETKNG